MRLLKVSVIGTLAALALSLSGCDLFTAGLGARVDLSPPEVRITNPVNNAYIGYSEGKIIISGTVTDDGAISSVDLFWENGAKSRKATISGNNWSVTFNQGELPDARYVFTARATDASGKNGEWQSTVNVDTTSPSGAFIFAADRGTSQDNPYNGKEKIQGMAEDGSGRLSSVVVTLGGVRIFPTDTNPTPDASELASWNTELDFDDVVTGLVTDGSKWRNAAFSNISDNLYSAELKLIVTDQAGNSAEFTKVCFVDLTYDAPRITWPASMDVSNDATYPRDPTQYSGNIFKNGDTVDITVEDDDAVNRSSAKLILESGTGTKYEYTVANSGLVANPSGTTKATSVRFRFTVPLEAQLPQGEYKFSFEVSDDAAYKNGKNFRTTSVAEKSFVVDNGPPTLTVTPLASTVIRSSSFNLSGTASDGWDINSVQISLDSGVSWQDANLSGSAGSYTWTWNGTSTTEGYYNVQVRSVDRGGSKSSRDLQVTIDNTAPDLSFNQVYPIVESSEKKVNGIIRASITAADTNGLAGVRYWVYINTPPDESSQSWNGAGYVELSSAPYAVAIDTTSFTGTLYLRFGARDKAGNTKYITYDPLTIDQSTDNPTINLTNLNQLVSTWAGASVNLLESNARIIGLLSDDDGIDATTVQIRYTSRLESSSDPFVWGDWQAATSASSTSFDYTLPSDIPEGVRAVEVRVSDKVALKDGKPAVTTTIGPFYIAIDRQAPSLAVNSPSFGSYKGLGTFQIQGTASDSFALKDLDAGTPGTQAVIVRSDNANFDDTANNTLVTVAGDGSWSYSYTVNTGIDETKTFYILAQDFFNKKTVISHQIRLDTVPPAITITNPAVAGSWFESLARFDGEASDSTGIKTIYYWIGNAADTPPAVGNASWGSLAGNVNWSATVDLAPVSVLEGSKRFWVYSEDLAGNVSTPQSLQFYLDKANPMISGVSLGDGDYRKETFNLDATVGDSYQLKSVVVDQMQGTGTYVTIYSNTSLSGITSPVNVSNLPRDPGNPAASTLVDGEYTYRITVEDQAGKKTQLTRRIIFDDTKPIVEITSFTKYATSNKVNKTISFTSLASDANGLEGVKYFISTNGIIAPAYSATVGGSIVQVLASQSIDTTTLTDNTQYYLWVVAKDKAGNEGASSPLGFYVDQSTDLPVVSLTSLDAGVTEEAQIQGPPVKNLLVSSGKISGTVTDDDGLPATATIWIDKNKDGNFGTGENYTLDLTGSTLSKSFDFNVATAGIGDGTYVFKIEVADTTGVANAPMTPVWFAYDTAVPMVVLNPNASDGNPIGPYRRADFTVQGTVQDANGISKVEFSIDNGTTWEDLGITATAGENKAWSKTITASSNNGAKSLVVRATDTFGRTSQSGAVTVTIDTVAPSGSINAFASGYYADAQLAIAGTASDGLSGVAKVEYSLSAGTGPWSMLTGTASWFKNDIDASGLAEGTQTVWVKVTDNAGNESAVVSRTFTVDHNPPTLTVNSAFDGAVYKNADFTIDGTVSDTNLGASPIAVTAKKDGAVYTLSGAFSYAAGSWSQVVNVSGSGIYEITITATDTVGRQTVEKRTITVDQTPPSVEITSVTKLLAGNKVNKTVTFTSLASDANGLEGVKYFISTDGGTAPAYTATVGGSIVQVLASQSIDTTTLTDLGTYYLWVVAKDKAGNEGNSVAQQFVVDQSTDLPVVSLASLDAAVTAEAQVMGPPVKNLLVSGGKISGTVTDDDGLAASGTLYIDKNKDGDFADAGENDTLTLSGSGLSKTFDYDVSGLADGTYRFYIDMADTTGVHNALMTPVWFAYDTAVPAVVFNANASDGNPVGPYRNADFTVQGTVQDANGIIKVEFSFDGSTWEDLNITASPGENKDWNKTISASSNNGVKSLVVRATDKFGRVGVSSSVSVTIDTVAPTISVTSPGTFVAGPGVTITGTSSDSGSEASGLDKVYYRVDGGSWQEASGTASWNTTLDLDTDGTGPDTGLSEGNHTLDVYVTDKAGNQSSVQSITLMVDQNIPALATITIDGTTFGESPVFRTTGFTLAGSVTDTNGVASVSITQTKEGGASEPVTVNLGTGTTNRTWTASISLSGEGSYTYSITVTDVAGRSTSATRTVVVDTQAPAAPTVSSPSINSWILGTSYTVSGSASDAGDAGIGAVYYVVGPASGYTPPADLASWNLASGTESWSGTINLEALGEGPKKLFVKAVDKAGNVSAQAERSFGIDQSAPSISLTGPAATLANGAITFTGTASDSYLVALITVAEKKPGDTSFTDIGTASYDSGTGTWSYVRNITGLSDGTYEYRITVNDGALKTTSVTKTITIDTTAPTVSFNQPAPYIVISGTVYGNGTMTMSGSASDLNGLASLEYRVGGGSWQSVGSAPYTSFTFSVNTTLYTDKADLTIEVRGTDQAGNVAVASYTLRVDQDTDKPTFTIGSPAEGGLVASQTITISGSLADDDGLNDATLYYRLSADGGTTWSPDWTQISSSYLTGSATAKTLSSFSFTNSIDGSKVLQLRIADINGNLSTKSITFTQDAGAPTISNISPATTGYRNGDFIVSGTATDTLGTVAAVRYRVVKDGATVVVNWSNCTLGSPGSATTTFTTETIPTSSGTGIYQVTFETEDDAGNKRQESYAYTVDKTLPSGSFASPASGSTTNNIITLSGTASDNFGLDSLRLAIMKGGTEVADLGAHSGANNWSLSFDTRTYDESTYATLISGSIYEITLRLIITDVAGNSTTVDRTFRIDQSTDIPQISFTTQEGVYLADSKIYGTATDDDGIASIEVSTNGGTSWTTLTPPTGGWGTSASWNYDLGSTDGSYSLRIRVTDTSSPAIVGTSGDATFLVDREAPDGTFMAPAANSKLKASDLTFTGTYGDENPVVLVQLKIDSSDFTSGAVTATMSGGSGSTSGTWSYTFATIPDGTRTIYARITDAAGRTTLTSRTVVVDTTGPVVSIIDPADLTSVYGKVTIRGSAEDATTTVKNIKIGIGKTVNEADYEGSPWYPATGTVSWSYTFNNINAYANTTYAVDIGDTNQNGVQDAGETWLNIWRMKIYIRAEDSSGLGSTGNISYVSTYTLEIDPNRDRPEVTVLDPDDGATIGGYKRIFGIAQDGQSVWKVQIAFDMNNNGLFNDAGDVWPSISGFTPPTVDESDSNTTAWYVVNGTTSWYQTINLYGEFNPTGTDTTRTIKFKVRAWDYKTVPGDGIPGIEVTRTVTFDKTVPQYASISHETGSTVGGSFTITGYVRDESGLQSIIFKHEGPRISSQELIGAASGQPRAVLVNSGEPGYVAGYVTYRLEIPINTTEAGLFPASSGIMAVALDAIDSSGFHSILSLSFNVDNILPSNLTYTAGSEIIGTQAEVQGTVRDTGVVSGIKQVVVYLKRGTTVLRVKGGSGSLDASGVLNLGDSAYNDYRIVIDNRLEDGNDTASAGDNDGFAEWLTISGGVYNWAARFNSTLVSDGKTEVHYVAYDFAGNIVSGSTDAYVANNKPSITSIVLGTDLNGDGDVLDAGEQTSPISTGYSATNFTAQGNRLYVQVNAVGGNGTKRYSVLYGGTEQNGTLTSNTVTIDTSSFSDSSSANDKLFTILVYDSTSSDDDDPTDELTATITVGLTIDNVDEVAPTAWLYQLEATDVKDYNPSDRSAWKGHIEPWNQSPYDNQNSGFNKTNEVFGNDADVSGTIVLRGGASDNQRINALYIWIDLDGNKNPDTGEEQQVAEFKSSDNGLVAKTNTLGTWSATSQSLTLSGGHTVEWKFEWNTANVSGVARSNVRIRVRAEDARPAANGGPNGSVQTPATPNDNTSLASGFNIMKVDVVPYVTRIERSVGAANTFRTKYGKYILREGEANSKVYGFNLAQTGTYWVRIYNSGDTNYDDIGDANYTAATDYTFLTLTNTSALQHSGWLRVAVNNVISINNINNNTLESNKEDDGTGIASTLWNDDRYIQLWEYQGSFDQSLNPVHPAMEANRSTWQLWASWSYYATSSMYTAALGPTQNRTQVFSTYDPPEWTDITVDPNGIRRIVYLQNYYNGGNIWGYLVTWQSGGQTANIERLGDDTAAAPDYSDGMDEQLYQFQNPRIAYDPVNNRNYVSYYDAYSLTLKYAITTGNTQTFTADNGNQTNGFVVVDGVEDTTAPPTSTGADVGLWSSIAVDSYGGTDATTVRPVIMYYDTTNSTLKIARGNSAQPNGTAQWTISNVFRNDDPNRTDVGYYVTMKMDSSGNIHAVAYRVSTGDLIYLYAPNIDGTGSYTFNYSEIIDSNGAVGSWCDIDLVGNTPYVSYLTAGGIGTFQGLKFAYKAGGNWEYGVVATNSIVKDGRTSIVARPTSGTWVGATQGKVAIAYVSGNYDLVILEDEE